MKYTSYFQALNIRQHRTAILEKREINKTGHKTALLYSVGDSLPVDMGGDRTQVELYDLSYRPHTGIWEGQGTTVCRTQWQKKDKLPQVCRGPLELLSTMPEIRTTGQNQKEQSTQFTVCPPPSQKSLTIPGVLGIVLFRRVSIVVKTLSLLWIHLTKTRPRCIKLFPNWFNSNKN